METFKNQVRFLKETHHRFFALLLVAVILCGVGFRCFELGHKLYWHDEVYTSMRSAGYTRAEIDQDLFQNHILAVSELQKYQHIKPNSTNADTIRSLVIEDPQHPPLYFLLARWWMQWFGSSRTASRALPALLSLIGLPLMYGLALELFSRHQEKHLIALLATALLSLSPFDILFAQTARQYSLLTVAVIGSSYVLLRSLRLRTWQSWSLYVIAVTIGFYTHPFFGLTLIGHGFFVGVWVVGHRVWGEDSDVQRVDYIESRSESRNAYPVLRTLYLLPRSVYFVLIQFFLAAIAALILYSPWLVVLVTNYQRVSSTTDWNRIPVGLDYLLKLWVLSFTSLFIDLDFGFFNPLTFLLRLPYVILIFLALYAVWRKTPVPTWLFIFTSIFIPFLMLALPDLLWGGKRSAVSRYLISCFPAVQLAVAYFLIALRNYQSRLWRGSLAVLLTGSVISCTVSAFTDTWWHKDLSYFNTEVVRLLPQARSPLLLSDIGDDYTNTGDLISLSYLLPANMQLLLLSQPPDLTALKNYGRDRLFLFRPSQKLQKAFTATVGQIELVSPSHQLWQLKQ